MGFFVLELKYLRNLLLYILALVCMLGVCISYRSPRWRIRLSSSLVRCSFVSSTPPPSAYSYKFVGTFSCAQIGLRKTRERELATLDEKSASSGIAEHYICAIKIEGKNRGGRDDTCDNGLSRSWKVQVCEKKNVWVFMVVLLVSRRGN